MLDFDDDVMRCSLVDCEASVPRSCSIASKWETLSQTYSVVRFLLVSILLRVSSAT